MRFLLDISWLGVQFRLTEKQESLALLCCHLPCAQMLSLAVDFMVALYGCPGFYVSLEVTSPGCGCQCPDWTKPCL